MTFELWREWNPGLENGEMTLRGALAELPGSPPECISALVRLFENPKSPFALKGAVSLRRHDCIHILLGRGLLAQDEAFVIGFTMGTSKDISPLETVLFKNITHHLYPKEYRFNKACLRTYELGLETGKAMPTEKIYEFAFGEYMDWTLKDIRELLSIDTEHLKKVYARERELIPGTTESLRLPV